MQFYCYNLHDSADGTRPQAAGLQAYGVTYKSFYNYNTTTHFISNIDFISTKIKCLECIDKKRDLQYSEFGVN